MVKKNTKNYSGHEKMSCKALGHTDDYETEATSLVKITSRKTCYT